MSRLLLILCLLSPLASKTAAAQANALQLQCDACRAAAEHPEDFANFAFNQVYGPDAWLSFDEADDFFVSNASGDTIYVDVDFIMNGWQFFGVNLPTWPTNMVNITIALPDGRVVEFIRSVFMVSLPVPAAPDAPPPDDGGAPADGDVGGGDAGGGDAYDDEDDFGDAEPDEWEEPEIDEPEGIVEIEDPDENGEFEEDDWCEEC